MINRRALPLMVSGAWDFFGVLLATSGFLLFVGPALLSGSFRQSLHDLPFSRDSSSIGEVASEIWGAWWVAWLLYYGLVIGGAAVLIWSRRNTTVIYNIESRTFEPLFLQIAQRLGLDVNRMGNRVFLSAIPPEEASTEIMAGLPPVSAPVATPRPSPIFTGPVIVDVETFSAFRNVSLHWKSNNPVARAELERELEKALTQVVTAENPVGGWFLGIAAFLFLAIMMMTALFVVGVATMAARR
jgi:hypothetical protein